jgi:hypothetical protein
MRRIPVPVSIWRKIGLRLGFIPRWEVVRTSWPYRTGYGTVRCTGIRSQHRVLVETGLDWPIALSLCLGRNAGVRPSPTNGLPIGLQPAVGSRKNR